MLKNQPTVKERWKEIYPLLQGVDFLVAHNAVFDGKYLKSCCEMAGFSPIDTPMHCSLKLCKEMWPTHQRHSLDVICGMLGIQITHHRADSDADACASIVLKTRELLSSVG